MTQVRPTALLVTSRKEARAEAARCPLEPTWRHVAHIPEVLGGAVPSLHTPPLAGPLGKHRASWPHLAFTGVSTSRVLRGLLHVVEPNPSFARQLPTPRVRAASSETRRSALAEVSLA